MQGLTGPDVTAFRLHGTGPDDRRPILTPPVPVPATVGCFGPLELPPLSITVVCGSR